MTDKKKFTAEDDALLAELGIEPEVKKISNYSAREERIISGFEEIQKFVEANKHLPEHGENKDIFERLYAIRLEQLRKMEDSSYLLKNLDYQNLLTSENILNEQLIENLSDDDLLNQLEVNDVEENSIVNLKHVKSYSEKRAAEEIANRTVCVDFETFRPLFETVKKDIDLGLRKTIAFKKDAGFTKTDLKEAQFIIVGGQISLIAEFGEKFKAPNGDDDARLRVIYSNGTESNILWRSLMRSMYKDETSRFITELDQGPLFSGELESEDVKSGTIYVLRSYSENPLVQSHRQIIHKIGITGGDVNKRIANAKLDPTYLMADVEVVATYHLANINRVKLEKLFHNFFSSSRLEVEIKDRFGRLVKAQEWFLVPLFVIDQVVDKIKDGTISDFYYDVSSATLQSR